MKAFVSHESALSYWRSEFPLNGTLGRPVRAKAYDSYAHHKSEVLASVPRRLVIPGKPIDVLVFGPESRRLSKQVSCHVWGTTIPPRAFYKKDGMCISSPEFVFLQMATSLSVVQLVALGCEFCGKYVPQKGNKQRLAESGLSTLRSAPLTDLRKLTAFVEKAKGARGRAKALRALKYIAEGARSSNETLVYMLLCLPPLLGGYGLPAAEMVDNADSEGHMRDLMGARSHEVGLCWIDSRLFLTSHDESRENADQVERDMRDKLVEHEERSGQGEQRPQWRVLTLANTRFFDAGPVETCARGAASHLKWRLYPRVMGETSARTALRDDLRVWMALD